MKPHLKIGTRESELAVWQASHVQNLLKEIGVDSELIFIKSEGDIDTKTPLYELGVQGIFTKTLDAALLNKRIDIAVHSMKDVPTQPAAAIRLAAVLKRASYRDILVFKGKGNSELSMVNNQSNSQFSSHHSPLVIATSSIRRKAQWLNRFPNDTIENLRGNVNTRLKKLEKNNWNGAIFAAAGLERINLRPANSIDLEWMLPAPAQGAITIACRENDDATFDTVHLLSDERTEICTQIERDFLRTLLGGCSTPISALAVLENDKIIFKGNVCSVDGKEKFDIHKEIPLENKNELGAIAANEILKNKRAGEIICQIRNGK
jgi:hydroxymethylbilane synthase